MNKLHSCIYTPICTYCFGSSYIQVHISIKSIHIYLITHLFMYNAVSTQFVTKLGGLPMVTYTVVKRSKNNGKSTPIFLQKELPL
jgi:hypothetical protein